MRRNLTFFICCKSALCERKELYMFFFLLRIHLEICAEKRWNDCWERDSQVCRSRKQQSSNKIGCLFKLKRFFLLYGRGQLLTKTCSSFRAMKGQGQITVTSAWFWQCWLPIPLNSTQHPRLLTHQCLKKTCVISFLLFERNRPTNYFSNYARLSVFLNKACKWMDTVVQNVTFHSIFQCLFQH